MSFGMTARSGEEVQSVRIGTNGSQIVMTALWFAAYAANREAEANRVCAWVDNGYAAHTYTYNGEKRWQPPRRFYTGPDAPPRIERNRPATVQPWIDFNFTENDDENTALCVQEPTVNLGIKMKAPTDPILIALVEMYRRTCDPSDYAGEMPVELVGQLADAFERLLARLERSCWYETLKEQAELFRWAAQHDTTVHYG